MEKFFGTILIFLLVFYIIRLLMRLLMPLIIKRMIKRANKRMSEQFGNFGQEFGQNNGQQATNEGDVTIQFAKGKQKEKTNLSDELGGEYVDFEEVK